MSLQRIPELAPCDFTRSPYITFYLIGDGAITGSIVFEESPDESAAGVWAAIGSPTNAAGAANGAVVAVHLTVAAYAFIRWRAATPVAGGTLTVWQESIPI